MQGYPDSCLHCQFFFSSIHTGTLPVRKGSVADPDPRSGAFWPLGSGIGFTGSRISYPGTPTNIFESLVTIFWVKNTKKYYLTFNLFKNKIVFNFVILVAYKKR
jgi:hypothetical protein